MKEENLLSRFIFENASVRGEFIRLRKSYKTILAQHDYPPPIKQLIGEALCVASLLCAIIKFEGRLTVQFQGEGKLKMLLAQCTTEFHVRALAKWDDGITQEELVESFKHGVLMINLDGGENKKYQGIVSWKGKSLAESIESYFRDSEQLATKVWLKVNKTMAAGLLLQIVPDKDLEKNKDDWKHILNLTKALDEKDLLELNHEDLLNKLYPEEEIRMLSSHPVMFGCTCFRKKGADAILIMGHHDAEEELKANQVVVVTCDFCNQEYTYDRTAVNLIFDKNSKPNSPTQIH